MTSRRTRTHDAPATPSGAGTGLRRAIVSVGCATLVGLSVVGCGSDPEASPSTTAAVSDWHETVDADCESLNAEFAELAATEPADADEAVDYAADVDEFAAAILDTVRDAEVPQADAAQHEELVELVVQLEAATTELSAHAADGDAEGAAAATTRIRRLGEQINPLAEALDVPSCGGF